MTHPLPCSCAVGLPGAVHSILVLPEVYEGGGQTGKVGDVVVQELGRLVHALIVAAVANLKPQKQKTTIYAPVLPPTNVHTEENEIVSLYSPTSVYLIFSRRGGE